MASSESSDSSLVADDAFTAAMATVARAPPRDFMMVKQEWAAIRIQTAFRGLLVKWVPSTSLFCVTNCVILGFLSNRFCVFLSFVDLAPVFNFMSLNKYLKPEQEEQIKKQAEKLISDS